MKSRSLPVPLCLLGAVTSARTFLRPEFATAPQIFAAAGWRTGTFGKWHLGDSYPHRPMDKGFQTAVWLRGWGFHSAPEFSNTLIDGTLQRGDRPEKFRGYITDVCFDEAMAWMRDRAANAEPFFCYLPLNAAHTPHIVPEKYSDGLPANPPPASSACSPSSTTTWAALTRFSASRACVRTRS